MTELCDLAFKYKTDKCPQIKHHFTEYYYGLFPDRTSVRKVVEIGIGYPGCMQPGYVIGASLLTWQEWFPNAQVYGADIDRSILFEGERIQTFYCDQQQASDLKMLVGCTGPDVDLFIDDGRHNRGSQVFTCLQVMPLLSKKTVYVIEDAASSYVDQKLNRLFDVEVWQPRHRRYYDDRLVIVRHSDV